MSLKFCSLCDRNIGNPISIDKSKIDLLVVGGTLSNDEEMVGRAFESRSGALIRKLIFESGFKNGEVGFTPVVRCGTMKPKRSEIRACLWWLISEINELQPKAILALGLDAAYQCARAKDFSERFGERIDNMGPTPVWIWHAPNKILKGSRAMVEDTKTLIKGIYEFASQTERMDKKTETVSRRKSIL